jgi:hypothetical protein
MRESGYPNLEMKLFRLVESRGRHSDAAVGKGLPTYDEQLTSTLCVPAGGAAA